MSEYTKPAVGFLGRAAAHAVILTLREREEMFLAMWPVHMKAAGYLEHTTAKREDCAQAFWGVLEPLFAFLEESQSPDFSQLILNERAYALFAVAEARRHRFRGITAEMYLGLFQDPGPLPGRAHPRDGLPLAGQGGRPEAAAQLSGTRWKRSL